MSAAEKLKLTAKEYLELERKAEFKSEFFEGEIFMMAGASLDHNTITSNLNGEIYSHLKGKKCQSFSQDLRIHIPENELYTYPDISIFCDEPKFSDSEMDTLINPSVIIEILSKSTSDYDRGSKFALYRQIQTLKEYIVIDSRQVMAEVWRKSSEQSWFLSQELKNSADSLHIHTIGLEISLVDIYNRVSFNR